MDTIRSMYADYLERAHSALDRLDRYLMLYSKPCPDVAQRILDQLTEDVMQVIAGGIAIREEEEVNGYHPVDDDIDAATYAVESARDRDADAYTEAIKRGDFFRDQLAKESLCPGVAPCDDGSLCPYEDDEGIDYAACWDEVERRQR